MPKAAQVDDKNTQASMPDAPNMVPEPEEIPSQPAEDSIKSKDDKQELTRRAEIYANFDKDKRPVTQEPEAPPVEDEATPPVSEAASQEPTEKPARKKPGPKAQVEITVNGVSKLVDKEKVESHGGKANYQKMVSANENLRISSERAKALDAREAQLKADQEEFNKKKVLPPVDEPVKTPQDLSPTDDLQQSQRTENITEALTTLVDDGDVSAAAKVLSENMTPAKAESVDTKQVTDDITKNIIHHIDQKDQAKARKVEAQAETERQAEIQVGIKEFAIEFPEILSDKYLRQHADDQTIKIAEENPDWAPSEILHQAGLNVTEWRKSQGDPALTSQQQKANEKRSMAQPIGGSGRTPQEPEPKQATPGDYVAQLRKQRNQPV